MIGTLEGDPLMGNRCIEQKGHGISIWSYQLYSLLQRERTGVAERLFALIIAAVDGRIWNT